ncbi:MAG: hypothetical protein GC193_10250 [Cryomorphaceae bacterium]|nr:hypothetical protein [Cryomorphaceae bacterium]
MKIEIIKGAYSSADAAELLIRIVDAKIKFHEGKINASDNEEDIKMRENRIRKLQQDLHEVRQYLKNADGRINLQSDLIID